MIENDQKQRDISNAASPQMLHNTAQKSNANAEKILSFLVQSGTINLDGVETQMKDLRRNELLQSHPYEIYQGSDT